MKDVKKILLGIPVIAVILGLCYVTSQFPVVFLTILAIGVGFYLAHLTGDIVLETIKYWRENEKEE